MNQISTCTFFNIGGFSNKWWALKQMQVGPKMLKEVKGLTFYKLLGSGAKNGFSSIPNFGTYVLLCVWESEDKARDFFAENTFFKEYQNRSLELFTVYLHPSESHGYWDGVQPFAKSKKLALDMPVLVLTRARIRFNKLWSFWTKVGALSRVLEGYDGLALSIGVGEWPLIQQATISIWQTQAEMLDYSYKNTKHKEVIMLTKKLNWYKEEMFARFLPYKFEGTWEGKNVENMVETLNLKEH